MIIILLLIALLLLVLILLFILILLSLLLLPLSPPLAQNWSPPPMLTLKPVRSAAEKHLFAECAPRSIRAIFPGSGRWIGSFSITSTRMQPLLSRRAWRGPFLPWRDGKAMAGILAHVWDRRNRLHDQSVGYFGFYGAAQDPEASAALLDAAASFAANHDASGFEGRST